MVFLGSSHTIWNITGEQRKSHHDNERQDVTYGCSPVPVRCPPVGFRCLPTGRDGTGRDGTGRDGTGRDGTGRDGTGDLEGIWGGGGGGLGLRGFELK